ncbi:hypothetical protein [Brachyspira pulli]|uniref:hypothetical protein n=1 Tax=Brachyspira pulli TaxID=310721 RepID=UPI00300657A5
MNKKLLLILSILMSLSLLSCAKSVTAPDNSIGIPGQELTRTQIEEAFKKLPAIYIQAISPSGDYVYFDFSQGEFLGTSYSPKCKYNITSHPMYVDQNKILEELKNNLTYTTGDINFIPNSNWESTTAGYGLRELTVTISSVLFTVPKDYKTITIWLNPIGNIFWQ